MFVGIPFMLGLIATLLHAVHQRRTFWECISVALSACALFGACVFFLAMEGIICLIMASVIVVPLSCLGALAGFGIQSNHHASRVPPVLLLSCLLLMGFEKMENPKPVPYSVTSMVEVDAPPEVVWSHVVSFSELPPVEDWIFKTGLAYPLRAEIEGEGVGAVRHCVFSTGAFVEPITIWDEPRHLRFDVTAMPEPMQEWTFYSDVHPPHLEGQTTQGISKPPKVVTTQGRVWKVARTPVAPPERDAARVDCMAPVVYHMVSQRSGRPANYWKVDGGPRFRGQRTGDPCAFCCNKAARRCAGMMNGTVSLSCAQNRAAGEADGCTSENSS